MKFNMSDWTLKALLEEGTKILTQHQIQDADIDAWYLMEDICGIRRIDYLMEPGYFVNEDQVERYFEAIYRRSTGYPLQYITGSQEFMGIPFMVNEHVLIPRYDTEVLVETVLEKVAEGADVLDMCTGSGCILLSTLGLKKMNSGTGVDLSPDALSVAMANEKQVRACEDAPALSEDDTPKVTWILSDLFEHVHGKFDVIVSNPPYIPTRDIEELMTEVRCHEPFMALDGTEDGLEFYRKIVQAAPDYLKEKGQIFFEIGYDQAEAVCALLEDRGFEDIHVRKDLAGLDRVVYARLT